MGLSPGELLTCGVLIYIVSSTTLLVLHSSEYRGIDQHDTQREFV